jgi:polyferredoxin
MLSSIIFLAIGAFIGWSFPQPAWAAALEEKFKSLFKK